MLCDEKSSPKFSNESMVISCPCHLNKTRRDSKNFWEGQSSPKTSKQIDYLGQLKINKTYV